MRSVFYYLFYFLWRVCRASRDPRFGKFRVHVVLSIVEMMVILSAMFVVLDDRLFQMSFAFTALIAWALPLAVNAYLFSDNRKREQYESRFRRLSPRKRTIADLAAGLFCLSALALPIVLKLILEQR